MGSDRIISIEYLFIEYAILRKPAFFTDGLVPNILDANTRQSLRPLMSSTLADGDRHAHQTT